MKIVETINDALYELGVVDVTEEPTPEDSAFALRTLNRILDSYNTQGLIIPFLHTIIYSRTEWENADIEIKRAVEMIFSRASTATYIDGGIQKYAAIDEPRYQDRVLLLEHESTNYIPSSDNYDGSGWIMNNTSVGTASIKGSDNIRDVFLTQESQDAVQEIHTISHSVAHLFGQYAVSWKVNIGLGDRNAYIRFGDTGTPETIAYYNLNDAKPWIGNQGIRIRTSVEKLANGWLILTAVFTGVVDNVFFGITDYTFEELFFGNSSGIYMENIQIEDARDPTSYIPTNISIESRAADVNTPVYDFSNSPYQSDTTDQDKVNRDTITAQPPTDIQQVFFRDNTIEPVDYMCTQMTSREYAQIAYKGYKAIPTKYFIKQNSPDSVVISFNAVPQDGLRLMIFAKQPYRTDMTVMDDIQWGAGVEKMLMLRLAVEVAGSYHIEVTQLLASRAMEAEDKVKTYNFQPRTIKSDIGLMKNRGRGRYNPARI